MSQEAPQPDPEEFPQLRIKMTAEFLGEARNRGTTPETLANALCEHFVTMFREGEELFEDWPHWSQEQQVEWCWRGASERTHLDFPFVEEEED